jgi:murein DD-endopeptidase MepM/ murein hydrolase activator NlpD
VASILAATFLIAGLTVGKPEHISLVPVPAKTQVVPVKVHPGSTLQVFTDGQSKVLYQDHTYGSYQIYDGRWRALIPLSALDRPGAFPLTVESNSDRQVETLKVLPRAFPMQHISLGPAQAELKETPQELKAIREALDTETPEQLWRMPFHTPLAGHVTTAYGLRRTYNGVLAKDYYHRGYDISAPQGNPILAPSPGKVVMIGTVTQGFRVHGNTLVIDHGQGVVSIYIHLLRPLVKVGDTVKLGQQIALVGSTGRASGPHLHWGLYVHGISIDPGDWLVNRPIPGTEPPAVARRKNTPSTTKTIAKRNKASVKTISKSVEEPAKTKTIAKITEAPEEQPKKRKKRRRTKALAALTIASKSESSENQPKHKDQKAALEKPDKAATKKHKRKHNRTAFFVTTRSPIV